MSQKFIPFMPHFQRFDITMIENIFSIIFTQKKSEFLTFIIVCEINTSIE